MNSLYKTKSNTIIDLSRINAIKEPRVLTVQGYAFPWGFEVFLCDTEKPVHFFCAFDTDANKEIIKSWYDELVDKWHEFKVESL